MFLLRMTLPWYTFSLHNFFYLINYVLTARKYIFHKKQFGLLWHHKLRCQDSFVRNSENLSNGFFWLSFSSTEWKSIFLLELERYSIFYGGVEIDLSLHKKWSFPLRISSVNVTKSSRNCWFGRIYWWNP